MPVDLLRHLPIDGEALRQEGERLANEAERLYANILLRGSSRSVLPGVAFLDLKFTPPAEQLSRIVQLLLKIFECAQGDITGEARAAKALGQVLKRLTKCPDLPPHGSPGRLTIPWRPIYACLLRVQFRGATWESAAAGEADQIVGTEAAKFHYQSLLAFARRARNFFPAGAAEEILDELRPYFCPHDERHFLRAAALLSWFLPDEMKDPAGVLNELAGVWDLMANGHEWNLIWWTVFSRMARHSPREAGPALQPVLPRLFDALLRTIGVPTGKSAPSRPDRMSWPGDLSWLVEGKNAKKDSVRKFCRMAVYTIGPDSATWGHMTALLSYAAPFFHPLNEGDHSSSLLQLLSLMCLNYAKRVGIEAGRHSVKKPWRGAHRLTAEDSELLVATMLPLTLTAFASKDSTTQFLTSQSMKDLASVCPGMVTPKVLDMLLPAIENVMRPHEVVGAIMLTSTMAGHLLREEGGLDLVGRILRLTVAGVDLNDPGKTMYTFRMLMSVLSQVPLMDPADLPPGSSKPEMLYGLQEWVVEMVDRVFSVLDNVPSLKKGFYMGQVRGGARPFSRPCEGARGFASRSGLLALSFLFSSCL